ncbi:MAG: hypothetical protein AAGA42_01725 [Actinomycetota bacterium]
MQSLIAKNSLLTFDGEVLEQFNMTESKRYHVRLMSKIEFNEKRKYVEFDFGIPPMVDRKRIAFDESVLPALREFMAPVIAAAG